MKISQKTVNGKKYLYVIDSIYINHGKTLPISKSLGSSIDVIAQLPLKKQAFLNVLIQNERSVRTEYWKTRAGSEFLKFIDIGKIERLRAELFRKKENIGEMGVAAIDATFFVDFIYNSNKIEGSRVPRESIERIVRNSSKERIEEVQNTIRAMGILTERRFPFTVKSIERLHSVLLAHERQNLGLRKTNDIVVGNAPVSDYRLIRKELTALLEWNKKQNYTLYPLEQAFSFYYRFERIHPFRDGNGRVGRLLMNEILKKHRYNPIIIWDRRKAAHMHAFEKAMDGNMYKFFKFMADQFCETHKTYLTKIEKMYDPDEVMNKFLKSSDHNE